MEAKPFGRVGGKLFPLADVKSLRHGLALIIVARIANAQSAGNPEPNVAPHVADLTAAYGSENIAAAIDEQLVPDGRLTLIADCEGVRATAHIDPDEIEDVES